MKHILISAPLTFNDALIFTGIGVVIILFLRSKWIQWDREIEESKRRIELDHQNWLKATRPKARYTTYINTEPNKKISYQKYLLSSHWQETRRLIIKRRGNQCEECKKVVDNLIDLHLHHMTYENFFNEYDEELKLLCKDCHNIFHDRLEIGNEVYEREVAKLKELVLNSIHFGRIDYESVGSLGKWAEKHRKQLRTPNHPFNKICSLLEKVTEPEVAIDIEDLEQLKLLCQEF